MKKVIFLLFIFSPLGVLASDQTTIFDSISLNKTLSSSLSSSLDYIRPEDLGIQEPKILPGSFLYWVKEIKRSLSVNLSFDDTKKVQKLIRFSNEKLFEIKKLSEKSIDKKLLEKELKEYDAYVNEISSNLKKIKDKKSLDSITDKEYNQEFVRQRIFDYIQEKTKNALVQKYKEHSLEKLGDIILEEGGEKSSERLKEYVDKNITFDKRSIRDINVLERLKSSLADEKNKKHIDELIEYAKQKIVDNLRSIKDEDRIRSIQEFLGDSSTTTVEFEIKNIIERIKIEKDIIQRDLKETS